MDFGLIDESAVRLYIRIMHYYHSPLFSPLFYRMGYSAITRPGLRITP